MFPIWASFRERVFDERFALHRYKSTSHASVVVAVVMGAWVLRDLLVHGRMRWDFLILMGIMAAVKIGFMVWYRTRD